MLLADPCTRLEAHGFSDLAERPANLLTWGLHSGCSSSAGHHDSCSGRQACRGRHVHCSLQDKKEMGSVFPLGVILCPMVWSAERSSHADTTSILCSEVRLVTSIKGAEVRCPPDPLNIHGDAVPAIPASRGSCDPQTPCTFDDCASRTLRILGLRALKPLHLGAAPPNPRSGFTS